MVRCAHGHGKPLFELTVRLDAAKAFAQNDTPQSPVFQVDFDDSSTRIRVKSSSKTVFEVVQDKHDLTKVIPVESKVSGCKEVGNGSEEGTQRNLKGTALEERDGEVKERGDEPMEGILEYYSLGDPDAMQGVVEYGVVLDENAMRVD